MGGSGIAAGAGVLRTTDEPDMGHYAVVPQDPEGNEFCVVQRPCVAGIRAWGANDSGLHDQVDLVGS
ncbi:VOC family protein [Streptomyces sp. NPDC051956]|uniref:VOC family protein n=1 Tax=Streptomyces sp. NPDC051956 TaxID=3365677 RepID=UPI0037CECB47